MLYARRAVLTLLSRWSVNTARAVLFVFVGWFGGGGGGRAACCPAAGDAPRFFLFLSLRSRWNNANVVPPPTLRSRPAAAPPILRCLDCGGSGSAAGSGAGAAADLAWLPSSNHHTPLGAAAASGGGDGAAADAATAAATTTTATVATTTTTTATPQRPRGVVLLLRLLKVIDLESQ